MAIRLNPDQEHRVTEALRSGVYHSPEEVIDRALEALHEQDEWLTANRDACTEKIRSDLRNWNAPRASPKMRLMRILAA